MACAGISDRAVWHTVAVTALFGVSIVGVTEIDASDPNDEIVVRSPAEEVGDANLMSLVWVLKEIVSGQALARAAGFRLFGHRASFSSVVRGFAPP